MDKSPSPCGAFHNGTTGSTSCDELKAPALAGRGRRRRPSLAEWRFAGRDRLKPAPTTFTGDSRLGFDASVRGRRALVTRAYLAAKPVSEVLLAVIPIVVVMHFVVLLITYVPWLTTAFRIGWDANE